MTARPASAAPPARGRRTLLALAALFFMPLAIAFWLYYGTDWRPSGLSSHGVLIDPPRQVPWAAEDGGSLRGRWVLVYVGDGICDADCRRSLHVMRQTRLALNAEMTRVQRVLLVTGNCCDRAFLEREHPGLLILDGTARQGRAALAAFPQEERARAIYIVDPLGNLMMREDAGGNPRDLLADLRKLLKLSHIG